LREHLVAVVSHELRTPVSALMGIVGLLREAGDELPPPKVADMLRRSDALTRRLSMLIEDLLAVSTVDHGELHVASVPVEVAAALRECAQTFPMIQSRVECSDDLVVAADPLRLQQILANFVRNSVKYGEPPVRMTAGRVDDAIEIRVRDHGAGVPADFVPGCSSGSPGPTRRRPG
jgi:signal transduction histidine kinase